MQDNIWLRLITVGLVLAALAIGYFLLSGRLFSNSTRTQSPSPTSVLGQNVEPTPTPSPSPSSAYAKIAERTQNQPQVLPKTGFPVVLAVVFSFSAIISGWSLRRFPH